MNGKLKGQVAIVTGAGRGIGREIAALFTNAGVHVVVAEIAQPPDDTPKEGKMSLYVQTDITDELQVESMVRRAEKEFGGIDILVNNAGINVPGPVADTKIQDWDTILDTYLKGTFICSRAVLPIMKKQGHGQIINIASVAGKRGVASAAPYSASKFGVIGFSQALALEVKDFNIRVSVICPGRVDNPNWAKIPGADRSKMLNATDVAQAILFVASQSDKSVIAELVIRPFPADPA